MKVEVSVEALNWWWGDITEDCSLEICSSSIQCKLYAQRWIDFCCGIVLFKQTMSIILRDIDFYSHNVDCILEADNVEDCACENQSLHV